MYVLILKALIKTCILNESVRLITNCIMIHMRNLLNFITTTMNVLKNGKMISGIL